MIAKHVCALHFYADRAQIVLSDTSPSTDFNTESTLEHVREVWRKAVKIESGEELRQIEVIRLLRRPYSTAMILQGTTGLGMRRVVLKQIANHPLNASVIDHPDQAAVEFDVLSELHPQFANIDRCAVPRPLELLSEINAYLMEFVDGHVLADRLNFIHYLADRSRFRELQQHFYDSGRWLAHFQEVTGRRLAPMSAIDNVVVRCHDRLQRIEAANHPRVPSNFRELATRFVNHQLKQLSGTRILVTGRHGDFGPWNMLANDDGVTVIDFFGYREDPLPVDILSMLVFLESQQHGLANSTTRIRTLRERFLSGLGTLPELPEPLVLLCEAQQRILQISGNVLGDHRGIFNRWERWRSLRANIAWFRLHPERSTLWPR